MIPRYSFYNSNGALGLEIPYILWSRKVKGFIVWFGASDDFSFVENIQNIVDRN